MEGTTTYVEMIANPNNNHISSIITCDFIRHLEKNQQYVAYLYINSFTTEEIAERMNIPVTEVEQLKIVISNKWIEYDK